MVDTARARKSAPADKVRPQTGGAYSEQAIPASRYAAMAQQADMSHQSQTLRVGASTGDGPSVLIGAVDERIELVDPRADGLGRVPEPGLEMGGGMGFGVGGGMGFPYFRSIEVHPSLLKLTELPKWERFVKTAFPPVPDGFCARAPPLAYELGKSRDEQMISRLNDEAKAMGGRTAAANKHGPPTAGGASERGEMWKVMGSYTRTAVTARPRKLPPNVHASRGGGIQGHYADAQRGNGSGAAAGAQRGVLLELLSKLSREASSQLVERKRAAVSPLRGAEPISAEGEHLEVVKEHALLHSNFDPDVARQIVALRWRETGRLSVPETKLLLNDMFAKSVAKPEKLLELWTAMLELGAREAQRGPEPAPFLDLDRLVLVPFRAVFLASSAFELVLSAYVQASDAGAALSARSFTQLCRLCLDLDPTRLDELTRNVAMLASKVSKPVHAPSILISTASLNVQPAAVLIGEFTALAKFTAARAEDAHDIVAQLKRLDKMLWLRDMLLQQFLTTVDYYTDMDESEKHETLAGELQLLEELQACLPMPRVRALRRQLGLQNYVATKGADRLYQDLNGIKARLLGPKCAPFELPELSDEALSALGLVADGNRKRQNGIFNTVSTGAIGMLIANATGRTFDDSHLDEDRWELQVRIVSCSLKVPANLLRRRMHLKARCKIGRRNFVTKAVETNVGEAVWGYEQGDEWVTLEGYEMRKREVVFSVVDEKTTNPLGLPLGEVRLQLADFATQSEGNVMARELKISSAIGGKLSGSVVCGVSLRRKTKSDELHEAGKGVPETVRISGMWTGYFEHERSRQTDEMQLVFQSVGVSGILISGSGRDVVGPFKIQGKAEDMEGKMLHWSKVYVPPLSGGFHPPAVSFRGERSGEVIVGSWAAAYDARARFEYRPATGRGEWSEQSCTPLSERTLALPLALPTHWERRFEVLERVAQLTPMRGVRSPQELDDEDWCDLFQAIEEDSQVRAYALSLANDPERKLMRGLRVFEASEPPGTPATLGANGGLGASSSGAGLPLTPQQQAAAVVQQQAQAATEEQTTELDEESQDEVFEGVRKVRALCQLHTLAALSQPRVGFEVNYANLPLLQQGGVRRHGDFTAAVVRAPLIATGGEFVMWLSELPQHVIYPKIAPHLPAITRPAGSVVGAPLSDNPLERAAFANSLGPVQTEADKLLGGTAPAVHLDLPRLHVRLTKPVAFKPRDDDFVDEKAAKSAMWDVARALAEVNSLLGQKGQPPLRLCVEAHLGSEENRRYPGEAMTSRQLGHLARKRAQSVREILVVALAEQHKAKGMRSRVAGRGEEGVSIDTPEGCAQLVASRGFAGASSQGMLEIRVMAPSEPQPSEPKRSANRGEMGEKSQAGGNTAESEFVDGERARVLIVELAELSKKLGAELDLTDCFLTFAFADVGTNDEQLFVTKLSVPSGQTAAAAAAAADASDSAVALVKQNGVSNDVGISKAERQREGGTNGVPTAQAVKWDERLVVRIDAAAFFDAANVHLRAEVHKRAPNQVGGPPYLPLELNDVLERNLRAALRVGAEVRREDAVFTYAGIPGGRARVLDAVARVQRGAHGPGAPSDKEAMSRADGDILKKANQLKEKGELDLDGALAAALDEQERDAHNGMPSDPIGRVWLTLADLLGPCAVEAAGTTAEAARQATVGLSVEATTGASAAAVLELSALMNPLASAQRGATYSVADRTVLIRELEMPLPELMALAGATEEIAELLFPRELDITSSGAAPSTALAGYGALGVADGSNGSVGRVDAKGRVAFTASGPQYLELNDEDDEGFGSPTGQRARTARQATPGGRGRPGSAPPQANTQGKNPWQPPQLVHVPQGPRELRGWRGCVVSALLAGARQDAEDFNRQHGRPIAVSARDRAMQLRAEPLETLRRILPPKVLAVTVPVGLLSLSAGYVEFTHRSAMARAQAEVRRLKASANANAAVAAANSTPSRTRSGHDDDLDVVTIGIAGAGAKAAADALAAKGTYANNYGEPQIGAQASSNSALGTPPTLPSTPPKKMPSFALTKAGGSSTAVAAVGAGGMGTTPRLADGDLEKIVSDDPYAAEVRSRFLKYQWEAAEELEVRSRVAELDASADIEIRAFAVLSAQLNLVRSRVVGRRTEQLYARKRHDELQLLTELDSFGREWLQMRAKSMTETRVLSAEEGGGTLDKVSWLDRQLPDTVRPLGYSTWGAMVVPDRRRIERNAQPLSPDVQEMVNVVKRVCDVQRRLVAQWEPLLVELRREAYRATYPEIFDDPAAAVGMSLGQGTNLGNGSYAGAGLGGAPRARGRRVTAKAAHKAAQERMAKGVHNNARAQPGVIARLTPGEVEQLYNGVLRKLWTARQVCDGAQDALRAMRPILPKWLDVIDKVDLYKVFDFWRSLERGDLEKWVQQGGDQKAKEMLRAARGGALSARSMKAIKRDTAQVFVAPRSALIVERSDLTGKALKYWTRDISTVDPRSGKLIVDEAFVATRAPEMKSENRSFEKKGTGRRNGEGPQQLRAIESVMDEFQLLLVKVERLLDHDLPPAAEDVASGIDRIWEYEVKVRTAQLIGRADTVWMLLTRTVYRPSERRTVNEAVPDLVNWSWEQEPMPPTTFELSDRARNPSYKNSLKEGFNLGVSISLGRPLLFQSGMTDVFTLRTHERLVDLSGVSFGLDDDSGGGRDKLRLQSCTITSKSNHAAWHFEAHPHPKANTPTLTEVTGNWAELPVRPLYRIAISTGCARGAGMQGGVTVQLLGADARSAASKPLKLFPRYNRWEPNSTDSFEKIADWSSNGPEDGLKAISSIEALRVSIDRNDATFGSSDTWFLDTISVWDRGHNTQAYFPFFGYIRPGDEVVIHARPQHLVMPPPAPAAPRLTPLPEARCASRLRIAFEFDLPAKEPRADAPMWVLQWTAADAANADRGSSRQLPFLPVDIDIASLGLQLGVRYNFRLAGANLAGQGAFSRPVPLVASAVASSAMRAAAKRQNQFSASGGAGGGFGPGGISAFVHISTAWKGETRLPPIPDHFVFCKRVLCLTSRREKPLQAMLQLAAYGGDSASAAARKLAAGIRLFEDACTSEAQWHRLDAKATVATGARPAPLVLTIGQAEVLNNVLRLTPLVKGVGQAGAAWLLRPLSVMHGFETLFKLRITRPKVGRHCNDPADGFAFVLHRDPKRAAALGGSGTQLGYGGMENVIAVQFCVRPSCAEQHAEDPVKSLALDFNEKILCKMGSDVLWHKLFYVKRGDAGQLMLNPHNPAESFFAPQFQDTPDEDVVTLDMDQAAISAKIAKISGDHIQFDPYEYPLAHRVNTVSVQTGGLGPVSTAPHHTRGQPVSLGDYGVDLADGREHSVRIVFEKSRYQDPVTSRSLVSAVLGARDREGGHDLVNGAHHISVFIDDEFKAKLSLFLDLDEVFRGLEKWDGKLYAGFTASTGRLYAEAAISEWEVYEAERPVERTAAYSAKRHAYALS